MESQDQGEIKSNGAAHAVSAEQQEQIRLMEVELERLTKVALSKSGYERVFGRTLEECLWTAKIFCDRGGFEPIGAPFLTQEMPDVSVLNPNQQLQLKTVWHQMVWKMPAGHNQRANAHKLSH
jgi:hypothetical protein